MEGERKLFIGGNWKSNGDQSFVKTHSEFLNEKIEFDTSRVEVAVCPTFIHIPLAQQLLNQRFIVAAQNVSQFDNGAYTGEISARQLKDMGVNWTLIGHSERRQYFGDDEEGISRKLKMALDNGLSVIACIGEKLAERESNQTMDVIRVQMNTLISNVSDWSRVVVAYEPVWAIGTGKTASPQQAQEVHAEIRNLLLTLVNADVANRVRIIYGGSVTDQNANELIGEKDIDGFLVGGASLKPAFKSIVDSCKN